MIPFLKAQESCTDEGVKDGDDGIESITCKKSCFPEMIRIGRQSFEHNHIDDIDMIKEEI